MDGTAKLGKARWLNVLALGLLFAATGLLFAHPARGDSYKQQMERNKQEHTQLWQQVKELNEQEGTLADKLADTEEQIEAKDTEIAGIELQLEQANLDYQRLLEDRQRLSDELAERKSALGQRARAIYVQDELTYLELLFGAANFSDLIDRVFFLQMVLQHDEQLVEWTRDSQAELAEKQRSVELQIADIDSIREGLEAQRAVLEDLRGRRELELKAINENKDLKLREIRELEEENKRIKRLLEEMARTASGYKGQAWTGHFARPCAGEITSRFGLRVHPIYRVKRMHTGVDISAPKGTTVKAGGRGKVVLAERSGGYGKTVIIDHGNGRSTLYAHLSRITCKKGDEVSQGDKIGEVGNTGIATGNHLHFEVRINGEPVNPETAL